MFKVWESIKKSSGLLSSILLSLAMLALITAFYLTITDNSATETIIGLMLGLFSLSLGFKAIDMSEKADVKYTKLLERLDKNVINLPFMFDKDILSASGQDTLKTQSSNESKELAQKRLDEDTRNVGYVRGELYQLPDGRWAINWGGEYPL